MPFAIPLLFVVLAAVAVLFVIFYPVLGLIAASARWGNGQYSRGPTW